MQISDVLKKNIDESLTISEAVEILADQKNAGDDSHLHMHMRDGFATYAKPQFIVASDGDRIHYEEAHMTTRASASSKNVVPLWDGNGKPPDNRFHLDERRMAAPFSGNKSKYDVRSGVAEIDEVPATGELIPRVSRSYKGKTEYQEIAALGRTLISGDPGDVPQTAKGLLLPQSHSVPAPADGNDWKKKKGSVDATVTYAYAVINQKIPKIPGSEKHTMFEDSESMAMYLCAALRSTAARSMLQELQSRPLGSKFTVGVFSKTAVLQVDKHIEKENLKGGKAHPKAKLIERVTDVDPHTARTPLTPNPTLNTFTYSSKDIDHLVLIMGKRADGSLNILTFYPSPVPTAATIEADNTGNIDLTEPVHKGPKIAVVADLNDMALVW